MILNTKGCKTGAFLGLPGAHGCRLDCSADSAGSVATAGRKTLCSAKRRHRKCNCFTWPCFLQPIENVHTVYMIRFYSSLDQSNFFGSSHHLALWLKKKESLLCNLCCVCTFFPYDFGGEKITFFPFLCHGSLSGPHWIVRFSLKASPFHLPLSRQSAPIPHTCSPASPLPCHIVPLLCTTLQHTTPD